MKFDDYFDLFFYQMGLDFDIAWAKAVEAVADSEVL